MQAVQGPVLVWNVQVVLEVGVLDVLRGVLNLLGKKNWKVKFPGETAQVQRLLLIVSKLHENFPKHVVLDLNSD